MKRSIPLLAAFLMVFSAAAWGQPPPRPHIGLYVDYSHSTHCLYGTGSFTFYCFALPDAYGLHYLAFSVDVSSDDITLSDLSFHPETYLREGDIPGDLTVGYYDCYYDWVVVFSATVTVTGMTENSILIDRHTEELLPMALGCWDDVRYCTVSPMLVNDPTCSPVSVEESSWGMIKDLYK